MGQNHSMKLPPDAPKVSRQVMADRAPRPPAELVGALQDRIHPTSGSLRAAKSIKFRSASVITIDPQRGFGLPIIARRGIRVDVIAERYRAGDSPEFIAQDFELTLDEVWAAIQLFDDTE